MMQSIRSLCTLLVITTLLWGCDAITMKKCSNCDGKKKVACTSCNRSGESNCSWCYGKGKKDCSNCNGGSISAYFPQEVENGYKYMTYRGHTEYVWVWGGHWADFPCKECNKTGKVKCSNVSCDDGKVKCTWCSGYGEKDCAICNGTGKVSR